MKKLLKIFLLCILTVMLSSFVSAADNAEAPKELKILAIGNSFSVDAMEYLWDIANDGGVKVVLGNLYIGGCTLDTHAKNIANDTAAYTYFKNASGEWSKTESTSVATAMADEDWDIVTVQQASHHSGVASSYSKLGDILSYIAKTAPDAKVYFHMTWAYQANSTHSGFANYNNDQMTMYNAIQSAIDSEVKTEGRIVGIIPSGTAIQNLRTSYIGDTVTRDGYHLSYDLGRYTAALTWFAYFTGLDINTVDYVPVSHASVITNNIAAVREAVASAIANPYSVTEVTAKEPGKITDAEIFESLGLNVKSYKTIDWVRMVKAYYNSASSMNLATAASNSPNFIASHIYTKETLPLGSILVLDNGYKYRPEGWLYEGAVNTTRPAIVSDNVAVLDEDWWGDFTLRAFNLSASTARKMTEADASHMRIYVPLYPDIEFVNTADTNGDGKVSIHDVLMNIITLVNKKGKLSDMDGDGKPALTDVIRVLKTCVR